MSKKDLIKKAQGQGIENADKMTIEQLKSATAETRATRIFREKTQKALAKIESLDELRESDKMVDYIFKVGRWLFDEDLDTLSEPLLMRTGGRLTGVYAYLGNKASRARGERDVYAQKRDEVTGELMLEFLDGDYKVTEARSRAKLETAELDDIVTIKEIEKNNYENLLGAADKMVSFIQTAIRVRENERFRGKVQDNF